jgi:hypothetical protein
MEYGSIIHHWVIHGQNPLQVIGETHICEWLRWLHYSTLMDPLTELCKWLNCSMAESTELICARVDETGITAVCSLQTMELKYGSSRHQWGPNWIHQQLITLEWLSLPTIRNPLYFFSKWLHLNMAACTSEAAAEVIWKWWNWMSPEK